MSLHYPYLHCNLLQVGNLQNIENFPLIFNNDKMEYYSCINNMNKCIYKPLQMEKSLNNDNMKLYNYNYITKLLNLLQNKCLYIHEMLT